MQLSVIGFGASPLGDVFDVTDEQEGFRAVHTAIDSGINFFDVAPFYGDTLAETRLGNALSGKRNDIFLATKCCRYGNGVFDFSYQRVLTSIDESLRRLKTDYVDLLQVHDIEFGDRNRCWKKPFRPRWKPKDRGKRAMWVSPVCPFATWRRLPGR